MGYSLSGVWSKLQVMGVVPCFLKFYFFFFFHLPPGISLCFLTNGVTSRALIRYLSRAVFILLSQYICLPRVTMLSFALYVFPSIWVSAEQSVHLTNNIKNKREAKTYPYKSPASSPPDWKLLFLSSSPATLFSALLSLCLQALCHFESWKVDYYK